MNSSKLIEQMLQRLGQELKGLLAQAGQERLSAGAVEQVVRQRLWHFGGQLTAVLLEAMDPRLVAGRPVHDRRTRTVVTLFGPVDLTRSRCRDGSYPLDEALGLNGQQPWTAGVQEAVSLLSCECSFETVSDLMERVLGVSISPPRVQQVAHQSGQRAAEQLDQMRLAPVSEPAAAGRTLVIATDGCQAPQRDGWHEVKVGTLYTHESRAKTAGGRGKLLQKEYLASLEKVEGFGRQLWQCAQSWGVQQARRVVCMGDGAPWIWNLAAEHFPGAVEIVDFYHALEHLWATGEALWGNRATSAATQGWVRHYRRQLKRGRVDLLIAAIGRAQQRQAAKLSGERATVVRRNLEYFQTHRARMQYSQYRWLKLPIGTGAVEGSCKFVVQSRFKRPGSRWSHPGLTRMLALKLMRVNHRWESLWPHLKAA